MTLKLRVSRPGALLAAGKRGAGGGGRWPGPGHPPGCAAPWCCCHRIRFLMKDWEALGWLLASLLSCPETFCSASLRNKNQYKMGINAK